MFLQKYTPPLIPPRGEVNAADAFDIGSFDEEDTKGIKVSLQYDVVLRKKFYSSCDVVGPEFLNLNTVLSFSK